MKLLVTGDWHLRVTKPENRTDDFFATQNRKLVWLLEKAVEEKCSFILQPGDLYDSFKIPHSLERYVISTLRKYKIKVLTVFGQHDLRYHSSDRVNTPLAVLEAAKVVSIVKNGEPIKLINMPAKGEKQIHIHGVSWGEEIPINLPLPINILLMHKMVIDEKEGWEKKAIGVQELFEKHDFDLMVTGDNHKGFAFSDGDRHLINCGSLLRSNIDQETHEPYVYVYDSYNSKVTGFPIPIEPFKLVMDVKGAKEEKKENEELDALIKGLKSDTKLTGLDFKKNLDEYAHKNKIGKGVTNILNEIMA